jgi:pSer/pThr/pTyr-binding forkhead associated (FHA) protein
MLVTSRAASMSLQVRLHHSLGERVIDLPERKVDQPIVVGRAAAADVQVPSPCAGDEHCAIYVHQGHWYVQDFAASGETLVNGQRADEPTVLSIGDVITIGNDADAPTIEIDPASAAAGETGYARATRPTHRPAGARRSASSPATAATRSGRAAGDRGGAQPPASAGYQSAAASAGAVSADDVGGRSPTDTIATEGDWPSAEAGAAAGYSAYPPATTSASHVRRRPARKSNALPITITIGVGVLILTGLGLYAYKATRPPPPPPRSAPAAPAKPPPAQPKSKDLFQEH